jgi:hypothetical protein
MKFSDVKENMWIRYDNQPCYVFHVKHTSCYVIAQDYNEFEIDMCEFDTQEIDEIKVNHYSINDVVVYTGAGILIQNELATITRIDHNQFQGYYLQFLDSSSILPSTPFDFELVT